MGLPRGHLRSLAHRPHVPLEDPRLGELRRLRIELPHDDLPVRRTAEEHVFALAQRVHRPGVRDQVVLRPGGDIPDLDSAGAVLIPCVDADEQPLPLQEHAVHLAAHGDLAGALPRCAVPHADLAVLGSSEELARRLVHAHRGDHFRVPLLASSGELRADIQPGDGRPLVRVPARVAAVAFVLQEVPAHLLRAAVVPALAVIVPR
mmetsp:Transcript_58572/g.186726  ORF Transcript_58572/g.186726 Transcript_58572/m.186726 type:complete len:205 (-) Transcript_58572:25-639(-)